MSNLTKLALEQSLKRFLLKKPLDKITIKDLTDDIGISRMSFYYHFKDIYDLVEWSCIYDATNALKGNKTYDTWQEGLTSIFEAVLQNKPFILNVYHTTTQDSIERFLFTTVHDLILGVVREKAQGTNITEEQIQFQTLQMKQNDKKIIILLFLFMVFNFALHYYVTIRTKEDM